MVPSIDILIFDDVFSRTRLLYKKYRSLTIWKALSLEDLEYSASLSPRLVLLGKHNSISYEDVADVLVRQLTESSKVIIWSQDEVYTERLYELLEQSHIPTFRLTFAEDNIYLFISIYNILSGD